MECEAFEEVKRKCREIALDLSIKSHLQKKAALDEIKREGDLTAGEEIEVESSLEPVNYSHLENWIDEGEGGDEDIDDDEVDLAGEFLDMYLEFPDEEPEPVPDAVATPLGATVPLSEAFDLVPVAGTVVPVAPAVPRLVNALAMSSESPVVDIRGFRSKPDVVLLAAGKGTAKAASAKNNDWAEKKVNSLRAGLGKLDNLLDEPLRLASYDMSIPLGDLPLPEIDVLLSDFFTRVLKQDGTAFPSPSLMNLLTSLNRVMRRASNLRAVQGRDPIFVAREFDIRTHPLFVKTQLTVDASLKKLHRDGVNKARAKVILIAVISDSFVYVASVFFNANTCALCAG